MGQPTLIKVHPVNIVINLKNSMWTQNLIQNKFWAKIIEPAQFFQTSWPEIRMLFKTSVQVKMKKSFNLNS